MRRGGNEHQNIGLGEENGSSLTHARQGNYKDVVMTLEQNDVHYRLLFESLLQGVICQDTDGFVTLINPAAQHILGQSVEQLRSTTSPFWQAIHEDGSLFQLNNYPAMVALRTRKPVSNVIMGIIYPGEQSYRWLSVAALPVSTVEGGEPTAVYTLFSDCTQSRHEGFLSAEQETRVRALELGRMQQLLDTVLTSFEMLVAPDSKMESWRIALPEDVRYEVALLTGSARFTAFARYVLKCQHILLAELAPDGDMLYPLWSSEAEEAGFQAQDSVIHMSALCTDVEQVVRFKAGDLFFLNLSTPLFADQGTQQLMVPLLYRGELLGVMAVAFHASAAHSSVQDVTLFKIIARLAALTIQSERELREKERLTQVWQFANEENERLRETKQSLLSMVKRDFRATLLNIQHVSEIIGRQGAGDEMSREFALDIYADTRRLLHMIDHVANLARLENGAVKLYATWLNMNALILEVLQQWRLVLSRRHIHVQTQLATALPLLQGDRNRLLQVINTLIDHAVRYAPQGSDLLIISHVEERVVRVTLRCHAAHIPPSLIEHIFADAVEPGPATYQMYQERVLMNEASIHEIVQRHGGQIWAESTPDRGFALHFTIRFAAISRDEDDEHI